MTRRLVTFSVEVYGDTPEEVRKNAEYIREDIQESLSELGEHGDGYSTKIVSIGDEPCPPTEDELEEEREEQARLAHVAQRREPGEHLRFDLQGLKILHARVEADDGAQLRVTSRENGTEWIHRSGIVDVSTWQHVCGHGVDHMKGDCIDCGARMRAFLHGLMRRPSL